MVKSIQYFSDISVGIFQNLQEKFYEGPTDMASFIYGISEELRKPGVLMVQETLEEINQHLRKSGNGHGSLKKLPQEADHFSRSS